MTRFNSLWYSGLVFSIGCSMLFSRIFDTRIYRLDSGNRWSEYSSRRPNIKFTIQFRRTIAIKISGSHWRSGIGFSIRTVTPTHRRNWYLDFQQSPQKKAIASHFFTFNHFLKHSAPRHHQSDDYAKFVKLLRKTASPDGLKLVDILINNDYDYQSQIS